MELLEKYTIMFKSKVDSFHCRPLLNVLSNNNRIYSGIWKEN